jgi:hypothetical protein
MVRCRLVVLDGDHCERLGIGDVVDEFALLGVVVEDFFGDFVGDGGSKLEKNEVL